MEPKDKLLPCQGAMLATREDVNGCRVYRCESTRLACVISGVEPDEEICWSWPVRDSDVKRPRHKARPPRQETHTSGARKRHMIRYDSGF